MKGFRQTRAQRAALKERGIKPGKVTKSTPRGQASGGWSPFGTSPARVRQVAPVDPGDIEYEAYDRARGTWFTHKPKR